MSIPQQDTICAISSPAGSGGIAVIRISGADAVEIVQSVFSADIAAKDSHTVTFGRISDEKEVIDECVITLFKGPNSYTGEDVVEIGCHGSYYIQKRILDLLVEKGCQLAEPGEFTKRAFLNGKMDLSQAEAVADLIASESRAAHKVAMKQMRGGFSSELKVLRQQLIDFASLIELELDFSEEDVEFADRSQLETLVNEILEHLEKLSTSFKLGNAIKNGIPTAIVGRPNVGKSTLLNTLLNEDRAIVSDIAGTTRDTIEESFQIKGIEFRLIDTAGLRSSSDQIETAGIERTLNTIQNASAVLFIYDASDDDPTETQEQINKIIQVDVPYIIVANKVDKLENIGLSIPDTHLTISALEQTGIEALKDRLFQLCIGDKVDLESTVVTNARHVSALRAATKDLQKVKEGMASGLSGDLLAMDIRSALQYLGSITGEVTPDDLLGNIFGKFCIGK